MDPDFFSYHSGHLTGDSFQNLSKSDYAKVIFCDLYYNTDSTVGCRFQITDNVHEDPCDYIGLFRVGYDNLSQCLASKMLSHTECEDDGKLLRCTFKPSELPELENGFYQFLYVTRDNEVCGASMPFQIKNSITKDLCSDEDVVADNSEDDFLVVRSNMAEKNRRLQALLDEMTEKCLTHESEMRKVHEKLKIVNEEKIKLEHLLKKACEEKIDLFNEAQMIAEEKNIICNEKEEAIRILKEKNKVFSSMFDNYSDKLKEFTELKDALEADKNLVVVENTKLQDRIKKLTEDLQNKQNMLEHEKEKKQELANCLRKEASVLTSKLDDARLMIEALEKSKQLSMDDLASLTEQVSKLQEKLKNAKCENLTLKTRLSESVTAHEKSKNKIQDLMSEMAALKLHIIEVHESKLSAAPETVPPVSARSSASVLESSFHSGSSVYDSDDDQSSNQTKVTDNDSVDSSEIEEENIKSGKMTEELCKLKSQCAELHSELEKKNSEILKLKEEILKANGVIEYLTKEKDSITKNGSLLQDALNESILRLNEASELYKKQFRKIVKLKKKLRKGKTSFVDKNSASTSVKDSCSSVADSADEAVSSSKLPSLQLPQNQNSDSDTGEHVLRHPVKINKKSSVSDESKEVVSQVSLSLSAAAENEPSSSKNREVPELQTLIEMNLEKFKNSKSKEDEILYSIPCPVCDQDVGVYMSSTEEMVKHLEMQHKQQVCPVCGRLFDMNLPPKYFLFHVEDHFVKETKK